MKKGHKHGKGVLVDRVGKLSYEGEFQDDKMHGQGLFRYDSGFSINTEWKNDKPIKLPNRFFVEQWMEPEKNGQEKSNSSA